MMNMIGEHGYGWSCVFSFAFSFLDVTELSHPAQLVYIYLVTSNLFKYVHTCEGWGPGWQVIGSGPLADTGTRVNGSGPLADTSVGHTNVRELGWHAGVQQWARACGRITATHRACLTVQIRTDTFYWDTSAVPSHPPHKPPLITNMTPWKHMPAPVMAGGVKHWFLGLIMSLRQCDFPTVSSSYTNLSVEGDLYCCTLLDTAVHDPMAVTCTTHYVR